MRSDRFEIRHAFPRRGEIDRFPFVRNLRFSKNIFRNYTHHLFHKIHHEVIVFVRDVQLHHREFRRVVPIHSFVPEILGDLKNTVQTSDDESLQIELVRDPQIKIYVQGIVMRHERSGKRSAVDGLERRGFDFNVAPSFQVSPHRRNNS